MALVTLKYVGPLSHVDLPQVGKVGDDAVPQGGTVTVSDATAGRPPEWRAVVTEAVDGGRPVLAESVQGLHCRVGAEEIAWWDAAQAVADGRSVEVMADLGAGLLAQVDAWVLAEPAKKKDAPQGDSGKGDA